MDKQLEGTLSNPGQDLFSAASEEMIRIAHSSSDSLFVLNSAARILESFGKCNFYDFCSHVPFMNHVHNLLLSLKILNASSSFKEGPFNGDAHRYFNALLPSARKFITELFIAHYCWWPLTEKLISEAPLDEVIEPARRGDIDLLVHQCVFDKGIQRGAGFYTRTLSCSGWTPCPLSYDGLRFLFRGITLSNMQGLPYEPKICNEENNNLPACNIFTQSLSSTMLAIIFLWDKCCYAHRWPSIMPLFSIPSLEETFFIDIFLYEDKSPVRCRQIFEKRVTAQIARSLDVNGWFGGEKNLDLAFSTDRTAFFILLRPFSITLIRSSDRANYSRIVMEETLDNVKDKPGKYNKRPMAAKFSADGLRLFISYVNDESSVPFYIDIIDVVSGRKLSTISGKVANTWGEAPVTLMEIGPFMLKLKFKTEIPRSSTKFFTVQYIEKSLSTSQQIFTDVLLKKVKALIAAKKGTPRFSRPPSLKRMFLVNKTRQLCYRNREATNFEKLLPNREEKFDDDASRECLESNPLPKLSAFQSQESLWCLAINGEFMDTFMSAVMLRKIEEFTGYPVYQLFDCITASSTASLLALGITASEDGQKSCVSTKQLISFLRKVADSCQVIKSPSAQQKNFHELLPALVGKTKLSDCLIRVLVSYVEKKYDSAGQPVESFYCFDRNQAQAKEKDDCLVEDAIKDSVGDNEHIAVNVHYNKKVQRRASAKYKSDAAALLDLILSQPFIKDVYIVSLSTGIENDNNMVTHNMLKNKLGLRYMQIKSLVVAKPDDCTGKTLEIYEKAAEETIKQNVDVLNQLKANFERKNMTRDL